VVKAVSEHGVRLNIKKATLRDWRAKFAAELRELGVAANATERAVRGETRTHKRTPIYRAAQRNDSQHVRKAQARADSQAAGAIRSVDLGQTVMDRTRSHVVAAWRALQGKTQEAGDERLAREIDEFVESMPPAQAERALRVARARAAMTSRSESPEHSHR
jgi:hypothetical protein